MAVVRYPPPQDTYQTPIHFRDSYHSEQRPRSYLNPLPSQMPKGERPDYSDPERIPGLPPLSSLNAPMDHYDYVPAGPQAAGNLGREVMTVECPWCHYVVETHVKRSIGVKAGGAAVLAAAIAWPLFWVPLVVPGLHRKTHYCPQCKRKIGRGKRR
ncbi:hypothetical protein FBU59_002584 [Linderina macrospora]|uniref:Uncharacterized protein n=1 Tax=Linderina macrospora TaxID=4868 RepID=A0ACC1JAS2_9FUNG|nr:hypothetical protein FBU59_002584 [Linderina macrospora]